MKKKRILCVEDSDQIKNLISLVLAKYEVITVKTISDALRLVINEKFDLYIFDFQLIDGTGSDLTFFIRNFDSNTPILFVAGACSINKEEVIMFGANGLVEKGTRNFVDELEQKVSQLLTK